MAYKNAFFHEMQFWSHCYTVVSYQALFRLSVYKITAVYLSSAKIVCFCTIRDFGSPTTWFNLYFVVRQTLPLHLFKHLYNNLVLDIVFKHIYAKILDNEAQNKEIAHTILQSFTFLSHGGQTNLHKSNAHIRQSHRCSSTQRKDVH